MDHLLHHPIYAASLYFGVNAMLNPESGRANVINERKLADSARLRALQSNLNPHFLFNALNGIAPLVREQDSTQNLLARAPLPIAQGTSLKLL
jgi:LytS/YehU family sensor histidine kinase